MHWNDLQIVPRTFSSFGRIKDIDIRTINELFLLTQPAHLQKLQGRKLEGDVRRAARAEFIRQRLGVA
jgi:protein arginine kinase